MGTKTVGHGDGKAGQRETGEQAGRRKKPSWIEAVNVAVAVTAAEATPTHHPQPTSAAPPPALAFSPPAAATAPPTAAAAPPPAAAATSPAAASGTSPAAAAAAVSQGPKSLGA